MPHPDHGTQPARLRTPSKQVTPRTQPSRDARTRRPLVRCTPRLRVAHLDLIAAAAGRLPLPRGPAREGSGPGCGTGRTPTAASLAFGSSSVGACSARPPLPTSPRTCKPTSKPLGALGGRARIPASRLGSHARPLRIRTATSHRVERSRARARSEEGCRRVAARRSSAEWFRSIFREYEMRSVRIARSEAGRRRSMPLARIQ